MVNPEQVKSYIEQGLECEQVRVDGDGHHYEARGEISRKWAHFGIRF